MNEGRENPTEDMQGEIVILLLYLKRHLLMYLVFNRKDKTYQLKEIITWQTFGKIARFDWLSNIFGSPSRVRKLPTVKN